MDALDEKQVSLTKLQELLLVHSSTLSKVKEWHIDQLTR